MVVVVFARDVGGDDDGKHTPIGVNGGGVFVKATTTTTTRRMLQQQQQKEEEEDRGGTFDLLAGKASGDGDAENRHDRIRRERRERAVRREEGKRLKTTTKERPRGGDEEVKKALEDEICSIISVHGQAGLDMVTANAVRKNLEAKFNCSLRSKKNFLKTSLINIIDSRNSSALEALPPPPPPGPPPLIPSPRPAAKDSSTKAKTASKSKKRSEEKTKEFSVPTVTHNDRERKKSKRQFNEISDTEGEYDDHNEGIYERVTQTRGVNSKGARSAAKKVKHTQPMT